MSKDAPTPNPYQLFTVKLDHDDRRCLRRVARQLKLTKSDVVRQLIRNKDRYLKQASAQ